LTERASWFVTNGMHVQPWMECATHCA